MHCAMCSEENPCPDCIIDEVKQRRIDLLHTQPALDKTIRSSSMSVELIKKFRKQISKTLDEASTAMSYNSCNDLPDSFWKGLTEEDKQLLLKEAYLEGIIDKEACDNGWVGDFTVAALFSKWFEDLE